MIPKITKNNKSIYAFTLIEMVIVLVIIGILLMATLYLSGEQIQKVKDKTVKESILAEMQSRYSRNLGSSSYAGMMYKTLNIKLTNGENKIDFEYNGITDSEKKENTFTDKFEIKGIIPNYEDGNNSLEEIESITLEYSPYKIPCNIGGELYNNVVFLVRVNNTRDYCFEILKKNCRLIEMSESKCKYLNDITNKSKK